MKRRWVKEEIPRKEVVGLPLACFPDTMEDEGVQATRAVAKQFLGGKTEFKGCRRAETLLRRK